MTSTIVRASLALACACAFVSNAPAALLSDLLNPGATITSADKVFSNFTWASQVDPTAVTVSPINLLNLHGVEEHGLEFTSTALQLAGAGGLAATMTYTVTPGPGRYINGNTLAMVATGNGNASIFETPTDTAGLVTLLPSAKFTLRQAGLNIFTTDHKDYLNHSVSVDVLTQIDLSWAGGAGSGPQISSFTQTFEQGFFDVTIPEPGSLGLALMGGLSGTAVFLRRRWG